tara:strand:- start:220 stop:1029 length:810 start_codon:yes stop_codon:yes gene_type:complete
MKIAIVGMGFVGSAVAYGFNHPYVVQQHIDPKFGTNTTEIHEDTDVIFVCVPTPMDDFNIVRNVMEELLSSSSEATIILKSTVPPSIVEEFLHPSVVYNPEFLTEKSAQEQFINPSFHILGGDELTEVVEDLYLTYSLCNPAPFFHMSMAEASLVKYTINSFLATKVTFFNQMYDLCAQFGANPSVVFNAVGQDSRIGHGHTKVPGFDNKRGFGGACFPKDTKAITNIAGEGVLSVIEEVIRVNNEYRSQYERDDREKEQNIVYLRKDK